MPFQSGNKHGNRFGKEKQPKNRKPRGKSKVTSIVAELRELAEGKIENSKTGEKLTRKEALAMTLFNLAIKGDIRAIQLVVDRIDGRAPEEIKHTHEGEIKGGGMGSANITIITQS